MTPDISTRLISLEDLATYQGPELYLFVGISTAGSSVHDAFPLWAPIVAPGSVLRGIDIPETAAPDQFRRLVQTMRDNSHVSGAVVTSHKLRLYRAIHDLLDDTDPFVAITHEINSIDTRGGRIGGYARDAQSLDIVLDTTGTSTPQPHRPFTCLGAGGSAIALMLAMGLDVPACLETKETVIRTAENARGSLSIVARRHAALSEIVDVRTRAGLGGMDLQLVLAPTPEDFTAATRATATGGVVANATGLGKLGPGSPVTDERPFRQGTLAWDFNYRGPLTFLQQAAAAGVRTEDGWDYFVAGWGAALAAVTGHTLTDDLYNTFRDASRQLRP